MSLKNISTGLFAFSKMFTRYPNKANYEKVVQIGLGQHVFKLSVLSIVT